MAAFEVAAGANAGAMFAQVVPSNCHVSPRGVAPVHPPNNTTRFCFVSYTLAANVRGDGDWRGDSASQFTADVAACTCVGRASARTAAALASAAGERQAGPMECTTLGR